jgi:hypothetical protein
MRRLGVDGRDACRELPQERYREVAVAPRFGFHRSNVVQPALRRGANRGRG